MSISAIILVAVCMFGLLFFVGGFKIKPVDSVKPTVTPEPAESKESGTDEIDSTYLMPKLLIDQLDGRNIVKTFEISRIPEEGIYLSHPSAKRKPEINEIYLANSSTVKTVSTGHIGIGYDSKGYYFTDNDSNNHTYLSGSDKPVHTVSIEDNMMVRMGQQWIRFRFPKVSNNAVVPFDDDEKTVLIDQNEMNEDAELPTAPVSRFGVIARR